MKKYTFIVAVTLLFGAYNASAQSTEQNQTENKEKLEKREVKVKNKATLKPAESKKSVSSKTKTLQRTRIEDKKVTPVRKEEDQ